MAEQSAYIAYIRRPRRIDVINGKAFGSARSPTPPPPPLPQSPKRAETSSPPSSNKWLEDPDVKRRRRVAKYKLYAVESKVKSSLKKSYRWIKRKCSRIIHGY